MCGIAGAVFWDGGSSDVDPSGIVRAMSDALAHRGPDGAGIWQSVAGGRAPVAAFGHRRLAIIDLTDRAAQPMTSDTGSIAVTFNGEIYNFKDVRRDLEGMGRRFKSDSDTEVILQGYEVWGAKVTDRLRGMFAFAIWDRRAQQLLLARDRLGIKPLYVYQDQRVLLFASEIRALLASELVPRRLDTLALDQFLAYQTVPAPRTLIDGVTMMAPGSHATVSANGTKTDSYWDLLGALRRHAVGMTAAQACARVQELLDEATALHLVSDVPVGVFLSGGVDSAALATLVQRSGNVPQTFSVSFPGTAYDEGPRARETAAALGTHHTEIPLTERAFRDQLPDALAAVDHPTADGVNSYVISRAVRQAGVKVALSGLGGDELFGGYPSFRRLRLIARYARAWRWSPAPMRRAAAAAVRTFGRPSAVTTKAAALVETDGEIPSTYPIMRQLFSRAARCKLLGADVADAASAAGDPYVMLLSRALELHPETELMSFVSYAEARTYMHDVLLRDTDQMSMRHGLEVRVPLLDHCLVEFVMSLPDALKSQGFPKQLLVEGVGGDVVPAVARTPKRGFVFPFDIWMRGDLREFCEHHLGQTGLAEQAHFDGEAVHAVWQAFLAGRETWSRPWALVALSAWLEQTRAAA